MTQPKRPEHLVNHDTSIRIRMHIAREHDPSNEDETCLWCGKKLRMKCNTEKERTDEKKPPDWECCGDGEWGLNKDGIFECSYCGNLGAGGTKYKVVKREPFFEGGARGDYGDNAFCGLRCGYAFGVTMARFGHRVEPRHGRGL